MKHVRFLTGFMTLMTLLLASGGQALAASQSIVQEIHVTAIVPMHRDIILSPTGQIMEIDSNTPEDITPTVYSDSPTPDHKVPLTDALYAKYRQLVPVGTARYGVLYKLGLPSLAIGKHMTSNLFAAKSPQQNINNTVFASLIVNRAGQPAAWL